jgi:hypothetical protein
MILDSKFDDFGISDRGDKARLHGFVFKFHYVAVRPMKRW